jgi:hypothetical protein
LIYRSITKYRIKNRNQRGAWGAIIGGKKAIKHEVEFIKTAFLHSLVKVMLKVRLKVISSINQERYFGILIKKSILSTAHMLLMFKSILSIAKRQIDKKIN